MLYQLSYRAGPSERARFYYITPVENFLLAFIPLLVSIDPVGTLPLFLGLTEGMSRDERNKLVYQAVFTALAIGLIFGTAGRFIFSILGITASDFRVAGGLLLLLISMREIFGTSVKRVPGQLEESFMGVVPLGTPIIAGPAMLTTLLILQDEHRFLTIMLALFANLLLTLAVLGNADRISEKIGVGASRAMAKVVAIFLAAIGVNMVRKGIETFLMR
jgi:multiple antibiotic resistance protein